MWWCFFIIGFLHPYDNISCSSGLWVISKLSFWRLKHRRDVSDSSSFRGKANYINLGSFLIKPVQRVMRYPLLLTELLGATPESHHDRPQLAKAVQVVKEINVNINEYKRRKDLGTSSSPDWYVVLCLYKCLTTFIFLLFTVMKYRKGDEDTFIDKISKLSMHSIIKKSNRVSSHLKQLTGMAPQVGIYFPFLLFVILV